MHAVNGRERAPRHSRFRVQVAISAASARTSRLDEIEQGRRCCSTISATVPAVARSLHVRLDEASVAALDVVRAEGLNDSQAVRTALHEAAERRRSRAAVREEVQRLASDAADREEMRAIREQLAELAPTAEA